MPTEKPLRRAVVTGGAGAIGSVLVRALLGQGVQVTVVDNLSSGRLSNLGEASADPGFRFLQADLLDPARIGPAFRGASEVWHLAANADIRRGSVDPRMDFDQGVRATLHVLEAVRAEKIPWIGFSSSSVVYGLPTVFPTPESYGPLLPQSQYGANKLASEALISAFVHSYGLRAALFRFANIVGPAMSHGIVYDLLRKLEKDASRLEVLGDGRQVKSYLATEDCVAGLLAARERGEQPLGVYNLGSSDQISAGEIAQKVVAALGGRARIEFTGGERGWVGDVPRQLLATDRARALGWKPQYTSAQAVDRSITALRGELGL
ncbi:MAG: SDR family NAD(P)-dependent oxidoreductase [Thermoplasmata archaeon]|nr:SDR family NAD(P)-dependent oxidoreductase [Thermoplasmata archaeon]MCI4338066.1 SDR family NAD(P)-dependent oxidoreductase [Thermoplasmata archaeon]MCI4342159.1 SDR family NAD(P)-dependent oxidoreductase [Thermoplasmata archaeon]